MVENLNQEIGTQICINDVLLVGTRDYTALGRPQVQNARVYATVEEVSQTKNVIVFKKKRRQGYQRSAGHRQLINCLKIDRIEHDLKEEDFAQPSENISVLRDPVHYNQIV